MLLVVWKRRLWCVVLYIRDIHLRQTFDSEKIMSSIIKKQGNVLILVSAMARHGSTKQLLLQSYFVNNYKNSYHSYEAAGNSLYLQKDIALLYREIHFKHTSISTEYI